MDTGGTLPPLPQWISLSPMVALLGSTSGPPAVEGTLTPLVVSSCGGVPVVFTMHSWCSKFKVHWTTVPSLSFTLFSTYPAQPVLSLFVIPVILVLCCCSPSSISAAVIFALFGSASSLGEVGLAYVSAPGASVGGKGKGGSGRTSIPFLPAGKGKGGSVRAPIPAASRDGARAAARSALAFLLAFLFLSVLYFSCHAF